MPGDIRIDDVRNIRFVKTDWTIVFGRDLTGGDSVVVPRGLVFSWLYSVVDLCGARA